MIAETAEELDELEYFEFCIHAAYDEWQERQVYGAKHEEDENEDETINNVDGDSCVVVLVLGHGGKMPLAASCG